MNCGNLSTVLLVSCLLAVCVSAQDASQQTSLNQHNNRRAKHRVGALTLSTDLNTRATQCAQYYANLGKIDHSCKNKNGAGENLWAQWGGSPTNDQAATSSANSWYSEVSKHDYNKDWQPESGHFSQMVWKNSKQLGFGVGRKGNMIVGCALYSPPGNYMGQFKDNVFPPQ